MSERKIAYRALCEAESSIPIFSQAWWLDATAGENWDVALVEKNGEILASLPYVTKRKFGALILTQPPLTQTLGPWLRKTRARYANSLGQQKDLMGALISQLPQFHHYAQNWHFSQQNWLPFFWEKFSQTTKYTYILNDLSDEQQLWSALQPNVKTDIRKATDRFGVAVRSDLSLPDFLPLNDLVFARQGIGRPYSDQYVASLDRACIDRGARKIFIAEDKEGKRHAGVYLIWDQESAYYLMGGGDPELRNSGATSLCMWEAIKFAATVTKRFDFEGSMIEPVERFFRAFGAVQTPYFNVSKTPSGLIRAYFLMKGLNFGK